MTRAFISYSHKDEPHRVELDKHLSLLKRQNLIDVWSDHCIRPGEEFDPAISAALEKADLVLLLVSADFIHSEYCFGIEMQRAMERHKEGGAMVLPIIVRPCDWMTSPLGRLKALPKDGLAVTKWPSLDDAFLDIVQQLRALLASRAASAAGITESPTPKEANLGGTIAVPGLPAKMPRSSNLSLPRTFTDEDRYDFLFQSFQYIQAYFDKSLTELQARNPGISGRVSVVSAEAFTAIIFRDGKKLAGCRIRLGSGFSSNGIAYSGSENAGDNSYNEMLSVETDKHLLYLTATMGMFTRSHGSRLTEEGAAEHLWTMFIGPLQH